MQTIAFLSSFNEFSVGEFVDKFQAARDMDEDEVFVRINTPGGDVNMGYSFIMTMRDFIAENDTHQVRYRGEGQVASMGAFATLYVSNAEAIEQTKFMFHRAAYRSWVTVTPAMQAELDDMNADLRKAMEKKVDKRLFKQITGVSIKDLFDPNRDRVDVVISARDAKKLGIIQKVVSLSPVEASRLNNELVEARLEPIEFEAAADEPEENFDTNPDKTMTAEEIKTKFPQAYAAIIAEGVTQGVAQEKDRAEAWLAFSDIDPKKVHEGIKAGNNVGQKDMAEFTAAGIKNGFVQSSKDDSPEGQDTTPGDDDDDSLGDDDGAGASAENVTKFEEELDKIQGVKKD